MFCARIVLAGASVTRAALAAHRNHRRHRYHASVNGRASAIEYIGNARTLVEGVVQINIRIPDPLPSMPDPGVVIALFTGNSVGASGSIAVR